MRLKSFAKINLNLKIIGLRPDNYHEIDTIIQNITLFDEIELFETKNGIEVFCDYPGVPQGKENIVYKAVEAFLNFTGIDKGVSVNIKKKIPPAAGLGGGSSNAACALFGLNYLFGLNLSKAKLFGIAEGLGSDVPFFIEGGTCRVRGRGEVVEKIQPLPETWLVLVVPNFEVKTKWAYEEYDKFLAFKLRTKQPEKLSSIEISSWAKSDILHNDLEEPVSLKHREIKKIKELMISLGAVGASMSGSGPSVFGLSQDEQSAKRIYDRLIKGYPKTFLIKTIDRSFEVV